MSITSTHTVVGMTCDHCAQAVQAELVKVPGVVGVLVHREAGVVELSSDEPVDVEAVRLAVQEAGYELAG